MADTSGYSCAPSAVRPFAGLRLEMDDHQFLDWTRLLEQRAGLYIGQERRSFLVSGVQARMRATGCDSSREYYEQLTRGRGQAQEWSLFIDKLTVHETSFFRHRASMQLVSAVLVPEAFEKDPAYLAWSVGCATGEETYSLAMQVDSCMRGASSDCHFGVTGTDISLPSLRHAREGVYQIRQLRDVPVALREQYCRIISERSFQVTEALRSRVCFSGLNLRDLKPASMPKFNLIFCQNLLIYYERRRRLEIVADLAECLRPGGVLVLGVGELLNWRRSNMEKLHYPDTLAYRRTD